MLTSRSTNGLPKVKPTLEILPDSRFIVFAGDEHEASSTKLTGRVRLNCPEAMSISKPRIRLEGKRKVSWVFSTTMTSGVTEDKRTFLNQERPLGSIESTHKVNEGFIEWPFEFELPASTPESVEGLRDTFIVYHLHAAISRPGWNVRDLTARAHLRIVRTLGQESAEMARSRINADIWANKLSYSISIPSDAVVFGTSITADVELSPIKKGIQLGRVEMKLMETVIKRISDVPTNAENRNDKAKSEEAEVARVQMDFPEQAKVVYEGETAEDPVMADEMYKFQATLPLPTSLHKCRQDVDSHQINITHRFKLMVNIHNPEGHVSQLVCRLPVKLFISPNLPINDRNEVHIHDGTQAAFDGMNATLAAPPQYGQHQLDQIFSDIDPAGYMSRPGSGSNTPGDALAHSRRASDENLQSLNGVAVGEMPSHGSAVPATLHSRLTNLQINDVLDPENARVPSQSSSGTGTPAGVTTGRGSPDRSFAGSRNRSSVLFATTAQSPIGSGLTSRRTSAEEETHNNLSLATYNLDDLSRVPSYNAALRTPIPATPFGDHPPSYIDATSRPPSPSQRPSPSRATSDSSITGTISPPPPPPPPTHVTHRSIAMRNMDEEARLRTLRAGT
ncbi:hypothetical protein AMS68_006954 [Peltaster fructicola]|uniref:Arrestin C-terminal-like domain-containing protein n=1 Tax=Peltaster fructicola TaxID=286661 RepID=A0A6H0Y357_9PEZI|nr:hypothetical protein AMS68_006954 [Peltaster fructicola]